jgi:uncharacterized membrane protein (UPF0182 family)
MYFFVLIVMLGVGAAFARVGFSRGRSVLVWAGVLIALGTLALFSVMSLWGEALWFHAVGYGARFWTFIGAQAWTAIAGAFAALALVFLINTPARRLRPGVTPWAELVGTFGGFLWGLAAWQSALLFVHRADAGITEPILHLDAGFYLFVLPFLELVQDFLLWILMVAAASAAVAISLHLQKAGPHDRDRPTLLPVATVSATLGLVFGAGALVDIFELQYSDLGVTAGPGWTDVHVRLPAYGVLAVLTVALGAAPFLAGFRRWAGTRLRRLWPFVPPAVLATGAAWVLVIGLWILLDGLLPYAFQALVVEPNEITFEKPYIANNIRLTRQAFGLDEVEQRMYPAQMDLTRRTVEQNRHLLSEVRLWDWRALDAVYQQFQAFRLYYEFVDVDVDRYRVDDSYRQVMVSARELSPDNLPEQSQTFVNRRFIYTHGYGLAMASVRDFTPEGLPNLLIKDIPPASEYASLAVERPQIYYGELTSDPVVVNTKEREFDHPRGEQNAYVRYQGTGGVELRSLWRKFLFGWMFDGTRFLLSSYPTAGSRVMFHRQIQDRVHTLAPFLTLDEDPYLVLADGCLYWILDAYTSSTYFPYSAPFEAPIGDGFQRSAIRSASPDVGYLDGINYLRNSVKVVVDAYEGNVDFYIFDPADPIIGAWRNALPGMFKPQAQMPAGLRAHARYPQGLLLAQGLVYAKYHMRDPEVFYNQEDLWVRATEKHDGGVEPVEPYYVMWQLPGSDQAQFVLMLPFTPKDRQVLIGWIAGLCDGADYGRFLAYQFPKERRVLGPQQVETKIDQDSYLSGQLTLWDQRGSNVIRGNVLAIPLDGTLLYVEPIYLRAETAAYPELRLVAVMHGDKLSYAQTFDAALAGLFKPGTPAAAPGAEAVSLKQAGAEANSAFERYLKAQGEGRFSDAAAALSELQELLARFKTESDNVRERDKVPEAP